MSKGLVLLRYVNALAGQRLFVRENNYDVVYLLCGIYLLRVNVCE